jgi:ATP-binding cassette subfamily B protein
VTVYPPIKDSNLAGGQDVLNGISFKVKAGERVALLGATGSGKSSLVNLLPRFYDPDDGRIEVDGNNVRDWDLETLRSNIGMVLQQTTLFSGTIRENITFGADNATFAEIQEAAKAAQAHNFILEMPDGYDSLVVERGANLSGGQKQRIAIARALLIQPGILILDDSTSAVDLETEALIQEALEKLMEGKTTFIVAQRINSVLNADRILVLDKGRLVAQGNHQQLLAKNSIYQEIFNSQLGNGSTPAGIPRGKQS